MLSLFHSDKKTNASATFSPYNTYIMVVKVQEFAFYGPSTGRS